MGSSTQGWMIDKYGKINMLEIYLYLDLNENSRSSTHDL